MAERHLCGTTLTVSRILLVVAAFPFFFVSRLHAQAVTINPGDDIQVAVDSNPTGTAFSLKAGVYRNQSVIPKDRDSFIGDPGAILSGATVLTSFTHLTRYWIATIKITPTDAPGRCFSDHPACIYPEDLFFDGALLQRVTQLSDVTSGKWYFDYSPGIVYLADDPTGHTVEISTTRHAFHGSASNVTIRGLIIQRYGNPGGTGAIHGLAEGDGPSQKWVVERNEIRFNHGAGIRIGQGMHVLRNYVHHNGQMGVEGGGDDILVEGNEIAYNNQAGYTWAWEAGGSKFAHTHGLVVRANYAHHNVGAGFHADGENYNVIYEANRTTANKIAGILHEMSFDAVIRYNTIENDGFNWYGTSLWYGSGIIITASSNVEVYGNTVTNCMNGITANQARRVRSDGTLYLVKNFSVHDNVITQTAGIAAGIRKTGDFDDSIFTSWNNRYKNNNYRLLNLDGAYYEWNGLTLAKEGWKSYGNDLNGAWVQQSGGVPR